MILTNCAACAAPLAHNAPRCVRCHTRYCNATCQHDHWRRGHKQICKKIHRAGNAEQYNADKKYKETVAVAVEKCADDTKGQTCYICTQALHWKTKEGLVRMCSCRGTAGFAHVSCLAEQAKILVAEVEENNLSDKVLRERWARWSTCSLCEQHYHGVVFCALGWACWKTYLDRPETDLLRQTAMKALGSGLTTAKQYEDGLSVQETLLSTLRRVGASEECILYTQGNLAATYSELGRHEDAIRIERDVYLDHLKLHGEQHGDTCLSAENYAITLASVRRFEEARSVLSKVIPVARRVFGENAQETLKMRAVYASVLYQEDGATLDDLREAVAMMEEIKPTLRRVLGGTHPHVSLLERHLRTARAVFRARATPPGSSKGSN